MSRMNAYKFFLIVWIIIWIGGFSVLCSYLYHGGNLSFLVWIGFFLLGVLNPGLSVFKEMFGTEQK